MEQFTVVGLCDCKMKVEWLSGVEVLKCGGVGWGVLGVWGCGMGGCRVWGCAPPLKRHSVFLRQFRR